MNEPTRNERRSGGYIVAIDGRPPGWKAEYHSEHRTRRKRLSATQIQARLEAIEAHSREVDRMLDAFGL